MELDPELGVPVILYTGVYLKSNTAAVAKFGLHPPENDPGTRFVERQLASVPADPGRESFWLVCLVMYIMLLLKCCPWVQWVRAAEFCCICDMAEEYACPAI